VHAVHTRTPDACGGQARQIWEGRANRQSSCDGKDVGGRGPGGVQVGMITAQASYAVIFLSHSPKLWRVPCSCCSKGLQRCKAAGFYAVAIKTNSCCDYTVESMEASNMISCGMCMTVCCRCPLPVLLSCCPPFWTPLDSLCGCCRCCWCVQRSGDPSQGHYSLRPCLDSPHHVLYHPAPLLILLCVLLFCCCVQRMS
jgi:hypothetical protein